MAKALIFVWHINGTSFQHKGWLLNWMWFEMVFFAATWLKSTSKRFISKNMPTMKKYINIQICIFLSRWRKVIAAWQFSWSSLFCACIWDLDELQTQGSWFQSQKKATFSYFIFINWILVQACVMVSTRPFSVWCETFHKKRLSHLTYFNTHTRLHCMFDTSFVGKYLWKCICTLKFAQIFTENWWTLSFSFYLYLRK